MKLSKKNIVQAIKILLMFFKLSFLSAFMFLLTFTISDTFAGAQDLEQPSWGTRIDEVRSMIQQEPDVEESDLLLYEGYNFGDMVATVGYVFNRRQRLIKRSYVFHQDYRDPHQYILDKVNMKNQLDMIYGSMEMKANWKDPRYSGDVALLGEAVLNGALEIVTVWYDNNSAIVLTLRGDDGRARMVLDYVRK